MSLGARRLHSMKRHRNNHGAYELTRAEAAKLWQVLTDAHRTSCYSALRLNGRFARHLYADGTKLSWR